VTRLLSNDFIYTNGWLTSPRDTLMLNPIESLTPNRAHDRAGASGGGQKPRRFHWRVGAHTHIGWLRMPDKTDRQFMIAKGVR
jgi:hypothetical protein